MNYTYWHGKKVFITGHTGFKGSWLSLWLSSLGAELTGYALKPPTNPSLFEEADLANIMTSIEGDIRDLDALRCSMQAAQPEFVIHMAAQPVVRYSYLNPVETYETNVMGTVNLLEAVRETLSVRSVVNVTTDKCYENKEWVWGYRESDPMGGYEPYSSSKGCAELVTAAYRSSFFNVSDYSKHRVALASARAGNVIGGGDWTQDRLIPDILAAFEAGRPVNVRNPLAIRPWQHVLEPLRGYLMLAERLAEDGQQFGEGWNFGPNAEDAKSVASIVEQMAKCWGDGANWLVDSGEHPHEAGCLKLDISKVRSHLQWSPRLRLTEAINLVVDWAKQRRDGANVRELTLSQIQAYQALLKE